MVTIKDHFDALGGQNDTVNGLAIHSSVKQTPVAGTRYLTVPGVVVLARPQTDMEGMAGFLAGYDTNKQFSLYLDDRPLLAPGSELCKTAGQLCYMSFGTGRTRNIRASDYFTNLKVSGHGSVFEHATYSLLLYGVSRSVTHELVRHRAGVAISQQSQRYVSGSILRFVERPEYALDEELHAAFEARIDRVLYEYTTLTNSVLARQQEGSQILSATARTDMRKKVQQVARSVLPNETEAPLIMTANALAWRHIIALRASAHAEVEIRELAVRIFLCLSLCDPILFEDMSLERLSDGTMAVHTEFPKI